jgi:hypothetical protein
MAQTICRLQVWLEGQIVQYLYRIYSYTQNWLLLFPWRSRYLIDLTQTWGELLSVVGTVIHPKCPDLKMPAMKIKKFTWIKGLGDSIFFKEVYTKGSNQGSRTKEIFDIYPENWGVEHPYPPPKSGRTDPERTDYNHFRIYFRTVFVDSKYILNIWLQPFGGNFLKKRGENFEDPGHPPPPIFFHSAVFKNETCFGRVLVKPGPMQRMCPKFVFVMTPHVTQKKKYRQWASIASSQSHRSKLLSLLLSEV